MLLNCDGKRKCRLKNGYINISDTEKKNQIDITRDINEPEWLLQQNLKDL